ncbi:arsenate reductase ArsC [uncultured Serinicoccus sp.]|uniref:arsenate reductase ArsC n=1 Tax=uncultured Serinicoccus sp. TaxID=735514 RepID=UPI002626B6BA|nr:arsenate reductase ArsC [uncultured Serinicoccus sp.]
MTTSGPEAYTAIVDDLTYTYEGIFPRESVQLAVEEAWQRLDAVSTIHTFLPVLVAKDARERLSAAAQAEGRITKKVPELLFVCVHNAGRSQMAAALAEHLSGGRVHVRSAGSRPSREINPLVVEALAERGISLTEAYPKPLTDSVTRAADVIVTMGCGDACPIYPGRRYEDWTVPDPQGADLATVRDIRDDLQARVTTLLRDVLD